MSRMVKCIKLGKELPGLPYPPLKGELGQRIFEQVSDEAWKAWLKLQTMLINENRLNPSDPTAQKLLRQQLEQHFFGSGVDKPKEWVPEKS